MRMFLLAATALSALATPALAQDRAPFTGPRAEAVVGWDRVSDGTGQDSGSSDGVVYGGAIGYDVQAGGAVLGLEAELTGSSTDTRADSLLIAGDRLRIDAGRDIFLGGRVGVAVTPNTLIYAKGGYTNARIDIDYRTPTVSVEDGINLDGYRLGAGAEVKLGANTYLKGEYRYSHYGEAEGYDVDLDRHQVLGGIGIRF
jgi:outer membrane immunogenic protein